MLFFGLGIKPGRYDNTIEVNDIAPTLATMLDIQTPSGSSGRVLTGNSRALTIADAKQVSHRPKWASRLNREL